MRKATTIALTVTLLTAACHTQAPTPAAADPAPQDTNGVIARFTRDIWPAVEAYRYHGQGSAESKRWSSIVDPDATSDGGPSLHDKAINLGAVTDADGLPVSGPVNDFGSTTGEHGLHLASTSLAALKDSNASVVACYTYTLGYYKSTETRPGASEATFKLHKTDKWYLTDIVNDHAVPDCQSSKA